MSRFFQCLSLAIALISGIGFLCLYLFRADLYAVTEVTPATLGELYPISVTALSITGFEQRTPGHVFVEMANAAECAQWQLYIGRETAELLSGPSPEIPLSPGRRHYELRPIGCAISEPAINHVNLDIHFGPLDSQSARIQELTIEQVQINAANIPILMGPSSGFKRWVPDVSAFSKAQALEAQTLLDDAGYDPKASTREKIFFLTSFVRARMPSGSPPAYLNTITPWSVFRDASEKGVGCFCRQWSLVYGYLANVVGIPTRNLFTGGTMGTVDMGSHAFSESYIAEEARWAFVDPTNDIAYITNRRGDVMTGADIYMASVSGMDEALIARVIDGQKGRLVPFDTISDPVRYFMHRENFLIYIGSHDGRYQMDLPGLARYPAKLWRFLFQPQQYFGYTPFISYHWLRPVSFFTALGAGLFFLGTVLVGRARHLP